MLNCPSCGSRSPQFHPATQFEGEVSYICDDPFHEPLNPTARKMLDEQNERREKGR